jgi:hypothetical protein
VATRCRSLRVELDRLDDVLDLLEPGPPRAEAIMHGVLIRDQVDQLDELVEAPGGRPMSDDDNVIDISNSMEAEQEVNAARERGEQPERDPRFSLGLTLEVVAVLQRHGYPVEVTGDQLVALQAALFGYLYGAGGSDRTEEDR